jgi:ABC-type Fe3+/spermidine/putrescine transport system ATPase subunit
VLDENLKARPESEIEEMLQTLGVALLCVTSSPDDRPTMKDVVAMMKEIKQERDECVKVFDGTSRNESNHCNEKESCPTTSSSSINVNLHYSPHSSTTLN